MTVEGNHGPQVLGTATKNYKFFVWTTNAKKILGVRKYPQIVRRYGRAVQYD